MTESRQDFFADTVFWIALVVKQDQYHERARQWSLHLTGRIVTTIAVLLETANALARPAWRAHGIALLEHLQQRPDVEVVALSPDLWQRSWILYRDRPDKAWSLTDCISFQVMQGAGLSNALTADEHFRQAGFRAVLLEEP
jgi:predicted nucleic acid-binding protein